MRKRIIPFLMAMLMIFSGCRVEWKAGKNDFLIPSAVFIPNPYFTSTDVFETVTKIVIELTKIIPDAHTEREVEQTTHNKRTTIPAKITDMVEIVNQYRVDADLNQLKLSDSLCEIAGIRAKEASLKWSHTRPNGQKLNTLLDNSEWSTAGENLAKYQNASPQKIVDAWMNSDSHKENLLNARYKFCGISEYYDGEIRYISMIFTD